jgi:hypothetical protein
VPERTPTSPKIFAVVGVVVALGVVGAWCRRAAAPPSSALEGTVGLAVTRHDRFGVPARPIPVKDRARVRAVVGALGVDVLPEVPCPPDYTSAELGILLTGGDVYARKNVYVWGLSGDAGRASVLVVTSTGCRGGPAANQAALARELDAVVTSASSSDGQAPRGEVWSPLPDASRRAEGEPER